MRRASKWAWLIKTSLIQKIGRYIIRKKIDGPSQEKRNSLTAQLYGRVWDSNGNEVVAEMVTPESYALTAKTAIMCAEKILNKEVGAGYFTPAGAFGADFIMNFEGVTRKME